MYIVTYFVEWVTNSGVSLQSYGQCEVDWAGQSHLADWENDRKQLRIKPERPDPR